MDRQIVYPGAIPLETDLLNTNRNVMIGLGKLIGAILGTGGIVNGLTVGPNTPAALNVIVSAGEIYQLQNVDNTAYSSLPADTTDTCVKQGIQLQPVTLGCAAPGTVGYSINYLIEATFTEVDGNAAVLPYYNASNPTQAYSGPSNTGAASNTVRQGQVSLQAKAGIAATTGSQTTPAVDAGYIALAVVTVAYGQTTIAAGNIAAIYSAQVLTQPILAKTSGRLLNIQTFSSSGTYTPTVGTSRCRITVIGGGGSGGGAAATTSTQVAYAGGGGGGGVAVGFFAVSLVTGLTVTIGAGAASQSNVGTQGGTSSVGGLLQATGGYGGSAAYAQAPPIIYAGGSGGMGSGGNISNAPGQPGGNGLGIAISNSVSGNGGGNQISGGVQGPFSTTAVGNTGVGPGSGGSGACSQGGGVAKISGAGIAGLVIIEEFA